MTADTRISPHGTGFFLQNEPPVLKDVGYRPPVQQDGTNTLFRYLWHVQADETYHPRKASGFEFSCLFITYAGRGIVRFRDDESHELKAGSFLFCPPSAPCEYLCPEGMNWYFYFLAFADTRIMTDLGLRYRVSYTPGTLLRSRECCEEIIEEITGRRIGHAYRIDGLLNEILVHCARHSRPHATAESSPIAAVRHWMLRHLGHPADIATLVRISGLNRTAFFRRFKRETGATPVQYFLNMKLEHARYMLETTNHRIRQVSEAFGFYDEFYFSRMFKQKYGVAPSRVRVDDLIRRGKSGRRPRHGD